MTIRLLDEHLINKIAAGEVIERPASVVKELVENSIDAGSNRIIVNITGGGVERIEVEDNGEGIPVQDVNQALLRHATSKINSEEDLFAINTMGFRGEALPSIASISHMEIYTQQEGNSGCCVQVQGGQFINLFPYLASTGTRIIVKDLFFNTPVRKTFLKSMVSEQSQIYDLMSKLALSRPDISFSFSSEKKLYFKTPGNGSLRDALIAINGRDFAEQFIDLKIKGEKYSVSGLVSKAEFHRANRKNQIFFVNHRLIKSPMLSRAVDEGYKGLLLAREYPGVILFLQVDHADVDINVHPQKTEVRFRDESAVFRLVSRGIHDTVNGLVFSLDAKMPNAEPRQPFVHTPRDYDYRPSVLPFRESQQFYEQERSFKTSVPELAVDLPGDREVSAKQDQLAAPFRILGQCFNSYIIVEMEGKLWLVDQHAAHERIMYTQIKNQNRQGEVISQILAVPLAVEVSAAQMDLIEQNQALFAEIGLQLEALGPQTIVIRSSPPDLQGQERELLIELLEMVPQQSNVALQEKAFCMMACKQAVKAGEGLTRMDMEQIMNELLQVEDYQHCPHGRPTFMEITHGDLDRRFKR